MKTFVVHVGAGAVGEAVVRGLTTIGLNMVAVATGEANLVDKT